MRYVSNILSSKQKDKKSIYVVAKYLQIFNIPFKYLLMESIRLISIIKPFFIVNYIPLFHLQRCVVVQEVYPDGLIASDGRLQPGDQIIEINGIDMTCAPHAQV